MAISIYRLLTICSYIKRYWNPIRQESPFLDLPLDIVYLVFDELPLHGRILLSQTCRDLRSVLRSKCYSAVRKASAAERLALLRVLGDILPDRRLCTPCRALHLVDHKDLPVTDYDYYYRPCPAPERIWSRHYLNARYAVAHRHVQLAIKYTRLGNVHQRYRARISQRFTTSFPGYYSMNLEFTAEPLVVHGRFILMTTFDFHEAAAPLSFTTLSHAYARFCPHLALGGTRHLQGDPFMAVIRSAFDAVDGQGSSHEEVHFLGRLPFLRGD